MRHIVFLLTCLVALSLSCSLSIQTPNQKDLYFIENCNSSLITPQLLQFVNKDEIYDLTPQTIGIRSSASPSPSKKYIAFDSEKGIFIMDTKTLKTTKLSEFGYHPSWSPDEKWLIFHFQENQFTTGIDTVKDKVYIINIESKVIYESDRLEDNGSVGESWSPTGPSVVYTANTPENISSSINSSMKGLYSYNLTEQRGHFLLKPDKFEYFNPFISSDGHHILYSRTFFSNIDGFHTSLVISEFDTDFKNEKVITDEYSGLPKWSDDSQYFILGYSIYDKMGNKITEIKMDSGWDIIQIIWGDSSENLYLVRIGPKSAARQLVSYDIKTGNSEVLYATTSCVYVLPAEW